MEDPLTGRNFTDTVLQTMTEQHLKLLTWQDRQVDLPSIQSALHHLYARDGMSNMAGRIAGRGTVTTT